MSFKEEKIFNMTFRNVYKFTMGGHFHYHFILFYFRNMLIKTDDQNKPDHAPKGGNSDLFLSKGVFSKRKEFAPEK